MNKELQEIQALRRKGASLTEFWRFIFQKYRYQKIWEQQHPQGKIALEIWYLFLKPSCPKTSSKNFLAKWEKTHPTHDPLLVQWWHILPHCPITIQKKAFRIVEKALQEGYQQQNIFPALMFYAEHENPKIRKKSISFLGQLKIIEATPILEKALNDPFTEVRDASIRALGQIGPPAREALPNLFEKLRFFDEKTCDRVRLALGKICSQSNVKMLFQLVDRLQDPNTKIRHTAIFAIGKVGKEAIHTFPHLIQAFEDESLEIREMASITLSQIGKNSPQIIAKLIETLSHPRWNYREKAASTLGIIGPNAKLAIDALIRNLQDPHEEVKKTTIRTLGKLGKEASTAITSLIPNLRDGNEEIQENTAWALSEIGSQSPETIPHLLKILQQQNSSELHQDILWILGKIGPSAKKAIPLLAEILKNSQGSTRLSTIWTLGEIGSNASRTIPLLLKIFPNEETNIRQEIVLTLGKIGAQPQKILPFLYKILKSGRVEVRKEAIWALSRFESATKFLSSLNQN